MREFQQDRSSYFLDQSIGDVPCRVRFAERDSLMSLSKWNGAASLSFATGEDHRGKIATGKNELVLSPDADARTKHVFRKLDGEHFEYDVVLLAEPETNRISVGLDFPEGLEFFRQPSLEEVRRLGIRCEAEVIDSYAVYWKERNGAFKTGKFCHIYRPRIYDARGRSIWGRLTIDGRIMTITIPEDWLSDAAYPVVVDPVVGTQTRGALNTIDWWGEGSSEFYFDCEMGLTKFTAPTVIAGPCTSYIYCYRSDSLAGQAVLFSDNGNKPGSRLSLNESIVNLDRTVPEWVSSTFSLSRQVASGETFWYGYNARNGLYTYYDVGSTFQKMFTDTYTDVPATFAGTGDSWAIIMSAYFSYSNAQAYTRKMLDTIGFAGSFGKKGTYARSCVDASAINGQAGIMRSLLRLCGGSFGLQAFFSCSTGFFRIMQEAVSSVQGLSRRLSIVRSMIARLGSNEAIGRITEVLRSCASMVVKADSQTHRMDFTRIIPEATGIRDTIQAVQSLIRRCLSITHGEGNVLRRMDFSRFVSSTLSFFDMLKPRLVLKKEELIFVSRITRELEFTGRLL